MSDLAAQLQALGLRATAGSLDDLLARATQIGSLPEHSSRNAADRAAHRARRSLDAPHQQPARLQAHCRLRLELAEEIVAPDRTRADSRLRTRGSMLPAPMVLGSDRRRKRSPTRPSSKAFPSCFAPPPSCSTTSTATRQSKHDARSPPIGDLSSSVSTKSWLPLLRRSRCRPALQGHQRPLLSSRTLFRHACTRSRPP